MSLMNHALLSSSANHLHYYSMFTTPSAEHCHCHRRWCRWCQLLLISQCIMTALLYTHHSINAISWCIVTDLHTLYSPFHQCNTAATAESSADDVSIQ